ncbi:hypothetical protein [Streptomyces sp. NBC_00328]|uniref:hypothetical protein n=1 Tax=Streptomyces sp. NBC_00328 TaxID=2903646 RepID=UPI002E2C521A|nr:hypothetical protein [Streptomyces sp. NBC_00328]
MTKIFSRTLGVAAVVGAFALAAAAPASADPYPKPGDDVRVSQIASSNEGANSGNDGLLSNHNGNTNPVANNIVDPSNAALINTVEQLGDFLAL